MRRNSHTIASVKMAGETYVDTAIASTAPASSGVRIWYPTLSPGAIVFENEHE